MLATANILAAHAERLRGMAAVLRTRAPREAIDLDGMADQAFAGVVRLARERNAQMRRMATREPITGER